MEKFICNGKLNLYLYVLNKRADGYHEIESLMSEIEYGDELFIDINRDKDELYCSDSSLLSDNLVARAVDLLRSIRDFPPCKIILNKFIPIASGMGGGSSDAANTILALNSLYDLKLSRDEIFNIAKSLGMDVSFFIDGGIQLATGRGEILERLEAISCVKKDVLIVYREPSFSSNIYSWLLPEDFGRENYNSLLKPVLRNNKQLAKFYRELFELDSNFKMTGAGGAFFLFGDYDYLDEIKSMVDAPFKIITKAYSRS
ncbi:MAG: 4-(cytidine 5'-diphospho)-2-C-methyl-D-erythritol kinase [Firmicutes bacterium]|nr:4-(cytidine 5'-diphospho)-2-C-methyl-D-erythritol kinase [Bacillota bacterium]